MNHQIARYSRAVVPPAAPACEAILVKRNFRGVVEPGITVQRLRRKIRRRRIHPGSCRIVAAQGKLHHLDLANGAVVIEIARLGAEGRTYALRTNLHNALVLLGRFDHGESVSHGVRHRLLAINVLARVTGIDYDPLVPVVGHRSDNAVDVLTVEQFLIVARRGQARLGRDFFGQRVAAIIQICRTHALNPWEGDGAADQAGPLHADSDHAKTNALAFRYGLCRSTEWLRVEKDSV